MARVKSSVTMTNLPFIPPVDPRSIAAPSREIYAAMGEANVYRMLEDFYRELEQSAVRGLFPKDMLKASQRSAAFYVGLLGGPPQYHERYGNPMMRARHMPFPIDQTARDEWLTCFERVLAGAPAKYNFPAEHLPGFIEFLRRFSLWMMNSSTSTPNPQPLKGRGE
jgi:hemoglobin